MSVFGCGTVTLELRPSTLSVSAFVACWCLIIGPTGIYIKGKSTFVIMHSSIVNGSQLTCDAHTVPEQHKGTSALFFLNVVLFRFLFFMFVILTVLLLFFGAFIF